jgi:predicted dehydrogenase
MVSRHHLIAWANIADQARMFAVAGPSADNAARRAVEYQGSYNRTIAHFVQSLRDNMPFETAPQDNLETLRLVEDCYRLSGWEALP